MSVVVLEVALAGLILIGFRTDVLGGLLAFFVFQLWVKIFIDLADAIEADHG
jgi:hypothetical protein